MLHWGGDGITDALFQGGDVFLSQAGGFYGVVNVDGDSGGAKEPVAGA